jgi:hypothetical protein
MPVSLCSEVLSMKKPAERERGGFSSDYRRHGRRGELHGAVIPDNAGLGRCASVYHDAAAQTSAVIV